MGFQTLRFVVIWFSFTIIVFTISSDLLNLTSILQWCNYFLFFELVIWHVFGFPDWVTKIILRKNFNAWILRLYQQYWFKFMKIYSPHIWPRYCKISTEFWASSCGGNKNRIKNKEVKKNNFDVNIPPFWKMCWCRNYLKETVFFSCPLALYDEKMSQNKSNDR